MWKSEFSKKKVHQELKEGMRELQFDGSMFLKAFENASSCRLQANTSLALERGKSWKENTLLSNIDLSSYFICEMEI